MVEQRLAPLGLERSETRPAKWARRALTVPGLLVFFALDVALLPLLLVTAAAFDLAKRRPWVALRFQLALFIALAVHVLGAVLLAGAWLIGGRWAGAVIDREGALDSRIEVWLARLVFRAAMSLYGMRLEVEGADALAGGPLIVMSRHVSLLDPLLMATLLPHGVRPRFVIKRELVWDPCVDFIGHRLPNTFVHRDKRDSAHEIARVVSLAADLGPDDAVVIFPEGTRFSPDKRERILGSLARTAPAAYARASELRNLLPPHPGGTLALLHATDDVDVVFCAHAGLDGANHFVDLARGSLLGVTVRVRLWRVPARAIPEEGDARRAWLEAWWTTIDQWIRA